MIEKFGGEKEQGAIEKEPGSLERGAGSRRDFRSLVGVLVEGSDLFPARTVGGTPLTILGAIESNRITDYVSENAGDRTLDAVHCLVAIYDELKKDEPDRDFIDRTVEQLKEYLQ